MPTFNRAHLIMETIESVYAQTYTNWDLMIMDDGSEDSTETIIASLNDQRIQFYKVGRTGRVSKIKNTGIQNATGELIAFLDSDDLWERTKLEKQVAAMKDHPEAGFCLTGGYTFLQKNEPLQYLYRQRKGVRVDNLFFSMFRSEIAAYTQALIFRRKCVDVSGYFDETKLFSDPDFILSLACHFKGIIIYESLFFRRLHEKNDSSEHWEERYNEWIKVIRSYRAMNKVPSPIAKEALFKLYMNYGEKCLKYRQRGKAIKKFWKGWLYRPFSIVPGKKIIKSILQFK